MTTEPLVLYFYFLGLKFILSTYCYICLSCLCFSLCWFRVSLILTLSLFILDRTLTLWRASSMFRRFDSEVEETPDSKLKLCRTIESSFSIVRPFGDIFDIWLQNGFLEPDVSSIFIKR